MPVRITPTGAAALHRHSMSIQSLIDRDVESVRRAVGETTYPQDPVLGAMSRPVSMAAAFVRRHGILAATVLGNAIGTLSDGRLEVLHEYTVPLTKVAADLVAANRGGTRLDGVDLPAEAAWSGTYRVDLVVISEEFGTEWIVEVKRMNAATYGRKLRRPLHQLEVARLSAAPILKGSYRISRVETLLVSLCGDAANDDILDRRSLDAFFGLPLEAELDKLDRAYARMDESALGERIRLDLGLVRPGMRQSLAQLVLVDTAGSDDATHGLVLSAADIVVVPTSDSMLEIRPAIEAMKSAKRVGTKSRMLFANMDRLTGKRIELAKGDTLEAFRFETFIPRRVAVRDAARRSCLLRDYRPAADVHAAFIELLYEISELANG